MHIEEPRHDHSQPCDLSVKLVLREAKTLHRAAVSESLAASLPVLRRLLSAHVLEGMSLPELSRNSGLVRRKHVLRTLAIEAGHSSWEAYRRALTHMAPEMLQHYDIIRRKAGYPNLWFSSAVEAEAYAVTHGGRSIRVGLQAVVVPGPQAHG